MTSRAASALDRLPRWTPNALTASRLVIVALAYAVILVPPPEARDPVLFAALVLLAVATDMADGPLARRLGTESPRGRALDTTADVFFYGSLVVWLYLWKPGLTVFQDLLPLIIVMAALLLGTLAWQALRSRQVGFHSAFTRTSATAGVVATLWAVLVGFHIWLVYGVVAILLVDLAHRFGVNLHVLRSALRSADEDSG